MKRPARWWGFWIALAAIIYGELLFPLLVVLRGLLRPRQIRRGGDTPTVSVIIAAFNEEDHIVRKLENTLSLDYPRSQLEIIVASDGSTDGTNERVAAFADAGVRLLQLPRAGKNQALNRAVAASSGELLLFTDADVLLARDALRYLVAPFADPEVGSVDGEEQRPGARSNRTDRLRRWLRSLESVAGSLGSAAGEMFIVRRSLVPTVPAGVGDDSFIALQVPAAHRRIVYEPRACWHELPAFGGERAYLQRRIRWNVAWFRTLWAMRALFNPVEYRLFALQLFSHKVLRRLRIVPVALNFATAPLLWRRGTVYRLAALGQLVFHGAALVGYLSRDRHISLPQPLRRAIAVAYRFDRNNLLTVVALWRIMRGRRPDLWQPPRAPVARPIPTDGDPGTRQRPAIDALQPVRSAGSPAEFGGAGAPRSPD